MAQRVPANLSPSLTGVAADVPETYTDGCHLDFAPTTFGDCIYGDLDGTKTVMLVGDSHAAHWQPALDRAGKGQGWQIVALTKSSCPATTARVRHTINTGRAYAECSSAHRDILTRVALVKPDLVVLSSMVWDGDDWQGVGRRAWLAGVTEFASELHIAGARKVLWLGDVPKPGSNIPECLSAHPDSIASCAPEPGAAWNAEIEAEVEEATRAGGGLYEATHQWLCVVSGCPVIVGNLLVYRDDSHLTREASRWLSEELGARVKDLLRP